MAHSLTPGRLPAASTPIDAPRERAPGRRGAAHPWRVACFTLTTLFVGVGAARSDLRTPAPSPGIHQEVPAAELLAALEARLVKAEAAISTLQSRLARTQAAAGNIADLTKFIRVETGVINGLQGPHVIIEGANLHICSGSGSTNDQGPGGAPTPLGLGNLVVGYDETNGAVPAGGRGGSHNVIIGPGHLYSGFGGFVAGVQNSISGLGSSVSGGINNKASGPSSSVSGGGGNTAGGDFSSVSGGESNTASGDFSSVSGGSGNKALGKDSSVSGGSSINSSGTGEHH